MNEEVIMLIQKAEHALEVADELKQWMTSLAKKSRRRQD